MPGEIIIPRDSSLSRALRSTVDQRRMVFFAGLPGVGKSLLLQQLALMAEETGRIAHLLQWDVARIPFETPDILARFPEIDGVTHAAVRKAVGWWARRGVWQWHRRHADDRHILIGELPLIGNRFIELVQPHDDDLEPLLSGEGSRYIVPVPTLEVRQKIVSNREQSFSTPRHEREAADAPPNVLHALWDELYQVAGRLGMLSEQAGASEDYDPVAYRDVYAHLLRHRQYEILTVDTIMPVRGSAYDLVIEGSELMASPAEVARTMSAIEDRFSLGEVERVVEFWYEW